MNRIRTIFVLTFILTAAAVFAGDKDMNYFDKLTPEQKVHGFTVTSLYEDGAGKAMGARFVSDKYAFVIDLLQIQSVPQGFFWVKSPPKWDKGEPHTCEHLLLGKGSVGQHVAALEQMTLGSSSAYTSQLYTSYHFNTGAGEDAFYTTFEAKLNALLHPDFTDEEIRREVCHVGVTEESDGSLWVEEKGTVYAEMVSAYEKPWYYIDSSIEKMLYGEGHPLVNSSGGDPAAIRTMTAEDMWDFHGKFHHLNNIGIIASIPNDIDVDECLQKMSAIIEKMNDIEHTPDEMTGIRGYDLPEPKTALPLGQIKVVDFPADNAADPGQIRFSWPAQLELDNLQYMVLYQFLEALANGASSKLYDVFVNSQTRKIEPGANWISGWASDNLGYPINISMGIDNSYVNEEKITELRDLVVDEIQKIYNLKDGSDEIKEFNDLVKGHITGARKWYQQRLNSPPRFGFRRGGAGSWYNLMFQLELEDGFRKSLVMKDHFAEIEKILATDKNIWKELIDGWQLLSVTPYAVGIMPSPEMLKQMETDKNARLEGYVEGFKKQYGTEDAQEAIAAYRKEFDAKTAELKEMRSGQKMPKFIDNPPLTLDDPLDYEVLRVNEKIDLVASTFENMTSATFGISLRLDVIPRDMLMYVAILPNAIRSIGVIKDGETIDYAEMDKHLREEVLGFSVYNSYGYETERIELTLWGSGSNREEFLNAIGWMEAGLHTPHLDEENIPRMMDLVNQRLVGLRNTPKRNEESWVDGPPDAFRFQHNPLFLSANCFMTRVHHLQRLKWQLSELESKKDRKEFNKFLKDLTLGGVGKTREEIGAMLEDPPKMPEREEALKLANTIIEDLKLTLPEIPDENLQADWKYLCGVIKTDVDLDPEDALQNIKTCLDLIAHRDNARMFMISNSADREATLPRIEEFAEKLDNESVLVKQYYGETPIVLERTKKRWDNGKQPTYVGLINENTRNGLIHFGATYTVPYDSSREGLLNALSGNLYAGGGSHGLFMKTWGAGLAYSNGIRTRGYSGRVRYYAERCPDAAETMRFVVDVVKEGLSDSELVEYVIALCFGRSRAADRYEARGEAMAADLADGFGPEVIASYRNAVMKMRNEPGLWEEVNRRLPEVYGKVFVGYGKPLSKIEKGNFFMIGPETQMASMEEYIAQVEEPQKILRLYPRDFWVE